MDIVRQQLRVHLRPRVDYASTFVARDLLHLLLELVRGDGVLVVHRLLVAEHVPLRELLHHLPLLVHRFEVAFQVLNHLLLLHVQYSVVGLRRLEQLGSCLLYRVACQIVLHLY